MTIKALILIILEAAAFFPLAKLVELALKAVFCSPLDPGCLGDFIGLDLSPGILITGAQSNLKVPSVVEHVDFRSFTGKK